MITEREPNVRGDEGPECHSIQPSEAGGAPRFGHGGGSLRAKTGENGSDDLVPHCAQLGVGAFVVRCATVGVPSTLAPPHWPLPPTFVGSERGKGSPSSGGGASRGSGQGACDARLAGRRSGISAGRPRHWCDPNFPSGERSAGGVPLGDRRSRESRSGSECRGPDHGGRRERSGSGAAALRTTGDRTASSPAPRFPGAPVSSVSCVPRPCIPASDIPPFSVVRAPTAQAGAFWIGCDLVAGLGRGSTAPTISDGRWCWSCRPVGSLGCGLVGLGDPVLGPGRRDAPRRQVGRPRRRRRLACR